MNTKSKVLVGLMALSLLGGVGSALALTRTGAAGTGTAGAFDQAIYLNWGTDQTSVSLDNVQNLLPGTPQYRYLEVSPKATKSVAGNVQLTFTLAATTGEHHIKGLSVSVYRTNALLNDENVAAGIAELSATPVLDEDHLSGTVNVAITAGDAAHEVKAYFALAIAWTGDQDTVNTSYTMSGDVTIAQVFVPAA